MLLKCNRICHTVIHQQEPYGVIVNKVGINLLRNDHSGVAVKSHYYWKIVTNFVMDLCLGSIGTIVINCYEMIIQK